MKKLLSLGLMLVMVVVSLSGCDETTSASNKEKEAADRQQNQYGTVQPVPVHDWSLERDLVIQLYNIRNMKALTHSVWRSDRGLIEGDCASIGFGIPYDTSLTNPLVSTGNARFALTSIEQAEPNGVFASKNTSATWVMCVGTAGQIEPIYIETKVTVYPYSVAVNYTTNRVTKTGKATVTLKR